MGPTNHLVEFRSVFYWPPKKSAAVTNESGAWYDQKMAISRVKMYSLTTSAAKTSDNCYDKQRNGPHLFYVHTSAI